MLAGQRRDFELQITKRRKTELIQTIIPILIKNKVRVVICEYKVWGTELA
jgi:hypothetical protein